MTAWFFSGIILKVSKYRKSPSSRAGRKPPFAFGCFALAAQSESASAAAIPETPASHKRGAASAAAPEAETIPAAVAA